MRVTHLWVNPDCSGVIIHFNTVSTCTTKKEFMYFCQNFIELSFVALVFKHNNLCSHLLTVIAILSPNTISLNSTSMSSPEHFNCTCSIPGRHFPVTSSTCHSLGHSFIPITNGLNKAQLSFIAFCVFLFKLNTFSLFCRNFCSFIRPLFESLSA